MARCPSPGRSAVALAIALALSASVSARAEVPVGPPDPVSLDAAWQPMLTPGPVPLVAPTQVVRWRDDLVLSGPFKGVGHSGASNIVAWSGAGFRGLPATRVPVIQLQAVGDDLFALQTFNVSVVLRLNGGRWDTVGTLSDGVSHLRAIDGELVVTGRFTTVNDTLLANGIARFDGSAWHAYPAGLPSGVYVTDAVKLADSLYVGFGSSFVGTTFSRGVAYLAHGAWTKPAEDLAGVVSALASDGSSLYATGEFTRTTSGAALAAGARWDGVRWTSWPGNRSQEITLFRGELISIDPRASAGDALLRFDGVSFVPYGDGLGAGATAVRAIGDSLAVLFNPLGAGLVKPFAVIGSGHRWTAIMEPPGPDMNGVAGDTHDALVFNDELVVAGTHAAVGTSEGWDRIGFATAWKDSSWRSFGRTLASAPTRLRTWSGHLAVCGTLGAGATQRGALWWADSTWRDFGPGIKAGVRGLTELAGETFAAGEFTEGAGQVAGTLPRFARFDGTVWSRVADGVDARVNDVTTFGARVALGGDFMFASGVPVSHFAFWDGSTFDPAGGSFDGPVNTFVQHGGDLLAGGNFATVAGNSAAGVARWDGTAWAAMGQNAVVVYDFGHVGDSLYAAGEFRMPDGAVRNTVARWNGSDWFVMGTGADSGSAALRWCEGYRGDLYAGGAVPFMFGHASHGLIRLPAANTVGVPVEPPPPPPPAHSIAFAAGPNPSDGPTDLRFTLPTEGHVTLRIFDASGRRVAVLADREFTSGLHTLRWATAVRPGLYFAQLRLPEGSERTTRFVILR